MRRLAQSTTLFLLSLLVLCSDFASAVQISAVTRFELWDSATNERIRTVRNGDTIPMREGGFNVKAILNKSVGSLAFSHNDNKAYHVEHYAPYFFCADRGGKPLKCPILVEGTHTIMATPYSFSYARGPAATANTVTFTIVPAAETPQVGSTEVEADDSSVATQPGTVVVPPLRVPSKPTGDFQEIRINCGGPAYIDTDNRVWSADKYFDGGTAYSTYQEEVIAGTTMDTLFQSERYGEFKYEIPVPEGDYQVILQYVYALINDIRHSHTVPTVLLKCSTLPPRNVNLVSLLKTT